MNKELDDNRDADYSNMIYHLPILKKVRLAQEIVAGLSIQELNRFLIAEHGQDALEMLETNESFLGVLAGKPLDNPLPKGN